MQDAQLVPRAQSPTPVQRRAQHAALLTSSFAILAAGIGLRIWLYRQPVNSDDVQYFWNACIPDQLVRMGWIDHTGLRIGLLYFVRAIATPFGYSVAGFYTVVFAAGVACGAALFAFARAADGWCSALLVLCIWATSSIFLEVDTRLVPDNIGLAAALAALALAYHAARLREGAAAPRRVGPRWWLGMFICGALLAFSFSARATFLAFLVATGCVLLLSVRRLSLLTWCLLGFAVAHTLEIVLIGAMTGDPLKRWNILLGYGEGIEGAAIFQGYTWSNLLLRYPRLLAASPAELALHVLGLCGAVGWLMQRSRLHLANFLVLAVAYGAIAVSVTQLSPPVPFLREKLRYYATAAPFFYLAAVWLLRGGWLSGRRALWLALPGTAVLLLLSFGNVQVAARATDLVRNGDDGLFAACTAIARDAAAHGHAKVVVSDFRTQRVARMLLRTDAGWAHLSLTDARDRPPAVLPYLQRGSYRLLNWQRLNANAQRHFLHAPLTHVNYRQIETHRQLLRHRHGAYLTDALHQPANFGPRPVQDMTDAVPTPWWSDAQLKQLAAAPAEPLFDRGEPIWGDWDLTARIATPAGLPGSLRLLPLPAGWSRYDRAEHAFAAIDAENAVVLEAGGLHYTGTDAPWRAPAQLTPVAPGDGLLVRFHGYSQAEAARVAVYLYTWSDPAAPQERELLAKVSLDTEHRLHTAKWTKPRAIAGFRVAFEPLDGESATIEGLQVLQFPRQPERIAVRPDHLVYTGIDLPWRFPEETPVAVPQGSWLKITCQAAAPAPTELSGRIYVWDAAGARAAQLPVSRVDASATPAPVTLWAYAPHDLVAVRVALQALAAQPVTISRPQVNLVRAPPTQDEIRIDGPAAAHSGTGQVWTAPDAGGSLAGEAFAQVVFDAQADATGQMQIWLYRWSDAAARPVQQYLGRVVIDEEAKEFAAWTWLSVDAAAFRLRLEVLDDMRVTVENLRLRRLLPVSGDHIQEIGGAW